MLTNPTASRRMTGRLMVLATVAVALPLTATRAIDYVDIHAPAAIQATVVPVAPIAAAQPVATPQPVAAAQPVDALALVAPVAPVAPVKPLHVDHDGAIMINGHAKRWKDLTSAEKAEVRRDLAEAKRELARTRFDREEMERDIREAMRDARIDQAELRRDLAEAREDIEEACREIDANAVHIRRSGQDPERIKAQVRASLKSVESIDVEAITRQALASVDHRAIAASVAAAEASVARAQAQIERIEEEYEDE